MICGDRVSFSHCDNRQVLIIKMNYVCLCVLCTIYRLAVDLKAFNYRIAVKSIKKIEFDHSGISHDSFKCNGGLCDHRAISDRKEKKK